MTSGAASLNELPQNARNAAIVSGIALRVGSERQSVARNALNQPRHRRQRIRSGGMQLEDRARRQRCEGIGPRHVDDSRLALLRDDFRDEYCS